MYVEDAIMFQVPRSYFIGLQSYSIRDQHNQRFHNVHLFGEHNNKSINKQKVIFIFRVHPETSYLTVFIANNRARMRYDRLADNK